MYDPIAVAQYGRIRHEEIVREVTEFWRIELERRERGESVRAPRKAGLWSRMAHLLTVLHR
jgi:hypothetical protein